MSFRKEIIVLSGGKNKAVVKLASSTSSFKGTCDLSCLAKNGKLYILGDKISKIAVNGCKIDFNVPFCEKADIDCLLELGSERMFGSTAKGARKDRILTAIDKYEKEKSLENKSYEKESKVEEAVNSETADNTDKDNHEIDKREEVDKEAVDKVFSHKETVKNETVKNETFKNQTIIKKEKNMIEDGQEEKAQCKPQNEKKKSFVESLDEVSAKMGEGRNFDLFDNGVQYDGTNFYMAIKPQLDEMFVCYPSETELDAIVPNSKWVKVDAEDDYYVVGLLYDLDTPSFICYGVPASFEDKPPKEIAEMCVWLPLDLENKIGKGFWVIYQSAVDGQIIK